MLKINNLSVSIGDKEILHKLNLFVGENEIHTIMGPNGSGKSTLAQTLMGSPFYTVSSGEITFLNQDITKSSVSDRSKFGLFLSFQYPSEVSGVTVSNYLRLIYNKSHQEILSPINFRKFLSSKLSLLDMKEDFLSRYLNEGFSGGEKKRMEMLQMLVLEPKLAILDEVDSGLDVDALKVVSDAVNYLHTNNKMSVLMITHYTRILKHLSTNFVHVMQKGQIIQTGGEELAHSLEESGYAPFGE